MNIFVAQNIIKKFSNHTALNHLSIEVPLNSIYGLLGPNGAGKTTLIRIINQIIKPDSGDLFLKGEKLGSKHISIIGYLPEERGLYKKMKIGEQAIYLAQLKGLNRHEAIKRLKYWFEKFEIAAWWNRKVEELSKGMQQKIQFIVTILHEPELLIFDEPFSGFDPINVNILKAEILKIRDKGSTIIFSTHNMASVEELCDHIALINKAKKILEGEVKDIKHRFKSNIFEINYDGFKKDFKNIIINGHFELLSNEKTIHQSKAKIRIIKGTQNELLNLLLPHIQIHSFNEIIPNMNDIFIQSVVESNNQKDIRHV